MAGTRRRRRGILRVPGTPALLHTLQPSASTLSPQPSWSRMHVRSLLPTLVQSRRTDIYIYIYISTYIYVCVCIYIYVHIYIYKVYVLRGSFAFIAVQTRPKVQPRLREPEPKLNPCANTFLRPKTEILNPETIKP